MAQKNKGKDIGIDVKTPDKECGDSSCPFHGTLPIHGQTFIGEVASNKMHRSVIVQREYMHYVPKYERYEQRTGKYPAHCPPCIDAAVGDEVRIAECRPLSKTISFVVVEKL